MITKYKIFEAQLKEDGFWKYEVGDIVKYRETKKNTTSKLMYKIIERTYDYVTLFSGPTRSVKKNSYILKSDESDFTYKVREKDIRIMRPKEIEQYKLEKELNKYNI